MNKATRKRLKHTFRLWLIPNSGKRAEYLRKHKIFHSIGSNCTVMNRKVPLYPELIALGNNVHLASGIGFTTHDAIHLCLNGLENQSGGGIVGKFKEKIGCIEIGDNVFVGSGTNILYAVKIGSNVVIGAGSIVNRDIPDNSVAAGIPARVIGSFDDFLNKRFREITYPDELAPKGHAMTEAFEQWCWEDFKRRHG